MLTADLFGLKELMWNSFDIFEMLFENHSVWKGLNYIYQNIMLMIFDKTSA